MTRRISARLREEAAVACRVYRVQDRDGRGPFKPGQSHQWRDADGPNLPTWMEEFGFDLFVREGRPNEFFGTAVRDLDGIARWFSPRERQRLMRLGYSVVALNVDRILGESQHQLVFARRSPLHRGAVALPWASIAGGLP